LCFVRRIFEQARHYNQHRLEEEILEKEKRLQTILAEQKKQTSIDEKKQQKMKRYCS